MLQTPISGQRIKPLPKHPAVNRFFSGHQAKGGPPGDGAPHLVFHHIPKTGGTWLTDIIIHNLQICDRPGLFYAPHWMTAAESAGIFGADRRIALILRDPVDRFVSAFRSRQRQGLPGYYVPWSPQETRVFKKFPDLESLLRGLGSLSGRRREAAADAVARLTLVPRDYVHAFGTVEAAQAALPQIRLCMPIDALSENLNAAMTALGFDSYEVPDDAVENRAPEQERHISRLGRIILRRYLARDYAIYRILRDHARALHGV